MGHPVWFGAILFVAATLSGCAEEDHNEVSFHGGGAGTQTGWVTCPDRSLELGVSIKGESGSIVVTLDAGTEGLDPALHEQRTYHPSFSTQVHSETFTEYDPEQRVTFTVVRTEDWQGRYTVTLAC